MTGDVTNRSGQAYARRIGCVCVCVCDWAQYCQYLMTTVICVIAVMVNVVDNLIINLGNTDN